MCASNKPPDDDDGHGYHGDDQQYHYGSTHKCSETSVCHRTWIPVYHGRPNPGSWSHGSVSVAVTVIKIEVYMDVLFSGVDGFDLHRVQ